MHKYFSNAESQFNGNISWIEWSTYNEPYQSYGFTYDGLNRLRDAKYASNNIIECEGIEYGQYDVNIQDYDLRGNMLGIKRNGFIETDIHGDDVYGTIDQLIFGHTGVNLLTSVTEVADISKGFKGTSTINQYAFGNLISDSEKGITNIDYNFMDLPILINSTKG